jgi:hypothetical protein
MTGSKIHSICIESWEKRRPSMRQGKAAVSILEIFDQSIARLGLTPKLGVVPKEGRLKDLGYRMLIIDDKGG